MLAGCPDPGVTRPHNKLTKRDSSAKSGSSKRSEQDNGLSLRVFRLDLDGVGPVVVDVRDGRGGTNTVTFRLEPVGQHCERCEAVWLFACVGVGGDVPHRTVDHDLDSEWQELAVLLQEERRSGESRVEEFIQVVLGLPAPRISP